MSSSFGVLGIKVADEKYKKMLLAFESCEEAGVDVPDSVLEFFGWDRPNGKGIEVAVNHKESSDEYGTYFDVNLNDVPEGVSVIRFSVGY